MVEFQPLFRFMRRKALRIKTVCIVRVKVTIRGMSASVCC